MDVSPYYWLSPGVHNNLDISYATHSVAKSEVFPIVSYINNYILARLATVQNKVWPRETSLGKSVSAQGKVFLLWTPGIDSHDQLTSITFRF